ncbi:MAG: hypothetical protein M0C28_46910, partial [Candidatus Moduliflexus flocculans]|nr:hypothetical protein [Candidatus Moduliflexus flocculans]
MLMIVTAILGLVLPIIAVLFFQSRSTGKRRRFADRLKPVAAFSENHSIRACIPVGGSDMRRRFMRHQAFQA